MNIIIINGPNLNLLGKREPEIYGNLSFREYYEELAEVYSEHSLDYFQSNSEGELVSKIQEVGFAVDGIVLNAAAYTHTSVAIADAIAAVDAPVIEVHISNVHARETFRHHSYVSAVAQGIIVGLGLTGYKLAIDYLIESSQP
ncbi:type II 3-dehydroquinate dehydratase [Tunicatimonas pelagia]|uniref:type II 3-dehydroquinate dehydratase n=1 Tax=Tunicatimonas pelagia TaxID=931531 RepID=UPI0026660125|nr:type II 3-dehydroquinate dehydratase [Tunicatimonas pelagia]WKN43689.1 type II 3-dehydroquinate dehydratase [Tunicatimonas pelagia]